MARRANLIQVPQRLSLATDVETAKDPVCGVEMKRKDSKTILFRPGQTVYFCSKTCLNQFLNQSIAKKTAACSGEWGTASGSLGGI